MSKSNRIAERRRTGQPTSCVGCLASVLLTMVVCAAIVWAVSPDKSVEQAAREGILIGTGVTFGATALLCGVPVLLLVAAVGFAVLRRRKTPQDDVLTVRGEDV